MAQTYKLDITKTTTPLSATQRQKEWQKRILDLCVAIPAICFLAPFLILVAVAIKINSRGTVLFQQTRTGMYGQPFTIYKFRTMYVHNHDENKQATRTDSRITAIGRFLRKTSVDELPQLFNVLKGDMSIVGPRPHALEHDAHYGARIPTYYQRFVVKPGLTGLAQIKDCRGETETINLMEERIHYDIRYINNWTIWMDIGIIKRTPLALLTTKHAY